MPLDPHGTDHASELPASIAPGTFVRLALCWTAGVLLATYAKGMWLVPALVAAGVVLFHVLRRRRTPPSWVAIALVLVAASWTSMLTRYVGRDHISQYVTEESSLIHVTGRVEGPAYQTTTTRGAFAERFSWEPPGTLFVLALDGIVREGVTQPAAGKLLVKIEQVDHRLADGMRISAIGWMQPLQGPTNPGERDFRAMLQSYGIAARLSLASRRNWQPLDRAQAQPAYAAWRDALGERAAAALRLGMDPDQQRLGLLDALLLGRRSAATEELTESFRQVGLAHVLAISGAHLAILLGLVWLAARLLLQHPSRAVLVVLVVLTLYLLALPIQVPIARAGLMAGLFCIGYLSGRRIAPIDLLALALVIVLVVDPSDLFNAGCQLSFGIVAGLLVFTRRVSQWLWPDPTVTVVMDRGGWWWWRRRAADYLAVSLVAFFVALPMVAFHFEMLHPLAIVLSLMALPVVTATLGLGYLKIVAGVLLPTLSMVLAGPLQWVTDAMIGLVENASTWPASFVELPRGATVLWALTATGLAALAMSGWFHRRRWTLAAATGLCVLWLTIPNVISAPAWPPPCPAQAPLMRLNMFAVGNGSCYLLRIGDQTIMFDCGSQAYLDVAERSVLPALRKLGVRRIDTLILSHADLDHICGVPALAKAMPIGRVFAPPHLLAQAEEEPGSTARYLIDLLDEQGLKIQPMSQGWRESWGDDAQVTSIWPPADLDAGRANDTSIVLQVTLGHPTPRRVLLSGDIGEQAIAGLLRDKAQLRADVVELPHHGSFVSLSPAWLEAVSPRVVLQSSGIARLANDRWAELLDEPDISRLITAQLGMVELVIDADGRMYWFAMRKPHWHEASSPTPR